MYRVFRLLQSSNFYAVPISDGTSTNAEEKDENLLADQDGEEDMQGDTETNYYDEVEDSANKGNPQVSTEKGNQVEAPARILTPDTVFEKDIGDSINLPCQTPPDDDGVIIWYKDGAILFQGTVPMSAKNNNQFKEDNSLRVFDITADDEGQYKCVCVKSKTNEVSITHTLKVRVAPSVVELHSKDNQTVLSVGQDLVLTCHAKGYPEPVISWHKEILKDGKMANERIGITGNTLTIQNISRKDEGKYLCFADNNVGKPARSYINIELTHPPIVSIEKITVNSDKDMDTELKCTVKAKPTATVIWLRNKVNLKSSDHVRLHNEGDDHILILKVEKSINLVKTPAVLEFIKPDKPTRDLVLTWKVESKTPIKEHELQYRKRGETEWKSVKPTVHGEEDGVYVIKYTLTGLGEGTYETRCRSQNRHGWSDYSDITVVEGEKAHHGKHGNKKQHKHHNNKEKPTTPQDVALAQQSEKESNVGESKNSSSSSSGSFLLSSIALLYLYIYRL
ncbi:hypothetical protein WA026_016985 [Henosepilachna vigintioctopunctata]|uniref:Ig-like domain-containing protein n=1 Tax=Henosepilachna vigintioctopunctata TaxID=420089 RepID=A0AAW1U076_9CUCU